MLVSILNCYFDDFYLALRDTQESGKSRVRCTQMPVMPVEILNAMLFGRFTKPFHFMLIPGTLCESMVLLTNDCSASYFECLAFIYCIGPF